MSWPGHRPRSSGSTDGSRKRSDASAAGDTAATEAALAAYSTIVVEATSETGGDPTATAALDASVTRHVTVLTALGATRAG